MPKLGRKAAFAAVWGAMRGVKGGPTLWERVSSLPRLFAATLTGRYDGKGRLAAMLLALVYIISPIDLIPDPLVVFFGLGLADDAVVAVWLGGAIISETARFIAWERTRQASVDGQFTPR